MRPSSVALSTSTLTSLSTEMPAALHCSSTSATSSRTPGSRPSRRLALTRSSVADRSSSCMSPGLTLPLTSVTQSPTKRLSLGRWALCRAAGEPVATPFTRRPSLQASTLRPRSSPVERVSVKARGRQRRKSDTPMANAHCAVGGGWAVSSCNACSDGAMRTSCRCTRYWPSSSRMAANGSVCSCWSGTISKCCSSFIHAATGKMKSQ
mmetsp:Transcript_43763/g.132451  ORF Transcript_43763/g.132451 Transcript_43763/m.132451 type:complete len:208 (+) Transcript_43763:515-1138(+)